MHVGTPVEKCVANNEERLRRKAGKQDQSEGAQEADPDAEPYTPELLDNLIFRYEEPSTHSRWDKPLFTIPWVDAEPPIADIWTALTGIVHPSSTDPNTTPSTPTISNPNTTTTQNPTFDTASVATAGTSATGGGFRAATRPKIKPHAATLQPSATNSSALYDLEKRTSAVISAIRTFTLANPSASALLATNSSTATATESSSSSPSSSQEPGISIPIPDCSAPIFIPAHIAALGSTDELAGAGGVLALPRLQRLKRQWIGLNRAYIGGNYAVGTGLGGLRGDEVGDAFVRFLNAEFGGVV